MALTTSPPNGSDTFSALFVAYYEVTANGSYSFLYSNIDDAFQFSVNNSPLSSYGLFSGGTLNLTLTAGTNKFVWGYANTASHGAGFRFLPQNGGKFYVPANFSSLVGTKLENLPNSVSTAGLQEGIKGFVYNSTLSGLIPLSADIPCPNALFDTASAINFSDTNATISTWPTLLINCAIPDNTPQIYWSTVNVAGSPTQTITIPAGIVDPAQQTITVQLTSGATGNDNTTNSFFSYALIPCSWKNPDGLAARTNWDGVKEWRFSQPVTNPVLAIYSLGQPGNRLTLSTSASSWKLICNSSTPSNQLCINFDNSYISGAEGYGIILFPGTYTSISIVSDKPESWTNYAWGAAATTFTDNVSSCVSCCLALPTTPTPTPVPTPTPTCWLSECEGINFPYSKVEPNQIIPVSVSFKNTGNVAWTNQEYFRLGSQDPQDNVTWGLRRVLLPLSAAPLKTLTFNFEVTAPSVAGIYPFSWKMLSETIPGVNVGGWFGETCTLSVEVGPPCIDNMPLTAAPFSLYPAELPSLAEFVECPIQYSSIPKRDGMQPEFGEPLIPVEPFDPTNYSPFVFTCNFKVNPTNFTTQIGNNGFGFPTTINCDSAIQSIAHDCYLALECGNDSSCSAPLMQEQSNTLGDGRFAAPCINQIIFDEECYLVIEEDGVTPFEVEENTNYFIVNCIEDN